MFNLDQSKNLLFGKELRLVPYLLSVQASHAHRVPFGVVGSEPGLILMSGKKLSSKSCS